MQTTTKHNPSQRQAHILAWQQSQLSRKAYCLEHNIKYLTFCSWLTKQRPKAETDGSNFIPVQVQASPQEVSNFATLTFSNRCTLQLHERVEAAYLQKLIAACN